MADPRQTPAMRQHARFKAQFPDCVLFFRMGDFYEMFDDDAVRVSKALGLTLTQRTEGVPMAGVPHHQKDVYLRKAIAAGFRVAVVDQVQDPRDAKGVVERAVSQVITPGTRVESVLLDDDSTSTLAAATFPESGEDSRVGLAIVDVSTGAFSILDCAPRDAIDALAARSVTELLFAATADGNVPPRVKRLLDALGLSGTPRPPWQFRQSEALDALRTQFGVATLAGFGLAADDPALPAAGALVRYLQETQTPPTDHIDPGVKVTLRRPTLAHLSPPRRDPADDHCRVDAVSLRALEIESTIRSGAVEGSLLGLFLQGAGGGVCRTAMGRRLLRDWLCRPLARAEPILERQRRVATLVEDRRAAADLGAALGGVQDVARISGRVALARATPRDIVALGASLSRAPAILDAIDNAPAFAPALDDLRALHEVLSPLASRIARECVDDPPFHLREGGFFRPGVDAQLDEARLLQQDAGAWLAAYQKRLIDTHALPGIKVGFNKVFGYYIELTASQARAAPAEFARKQTLKNAERYTTPELKDFESKVTTAEARAIEREQILFQSLCDAAAALIDPLRWFADLVASLDATLGLADKAHHRGWVRPEIVEEPLLSIRQGRHPVLDELLAGSFVPNDVELGGAPGAAPSGESPRLALITGPNMAGKSTYIRQVALITLLAHAGSFVPADGAVIGVCDRVFTRVGADDALHQGQSTFMVEMTETANILNNATPRSLVILDEIGRGTSTLDGLSLAWAIAEHLAAPPAPRSAGGAEAVASGASPRVLFATHYHELTELEDRLPGRVQNLNVSVREWGDEIVFLHRILPGRTDRSYGIHVARLAGVPRPVIERARQVLESLAVHHAQPVPVAPEARPARPEPGAQFGLFTEYLDHPALAELREVKLDGLSPLQAFDTLRRLKDRAADAHG